MTDQAARIILKSGKDQSLRRYHPWVFSGAIKKIHGTPAEGDLVHVFDNKDAFLACGHYGEGSIAVRILSFNPETRGLDEDFFFQRLQAAWKFRKQMFTEETNVLRLVNAEGDGLPGLIIDRYAGTAVIQCHSIGMHRDLSRIAAALKKVMGTELSAIYHKSKSTLPSRYAGDQKDGYLLGGPEEQIVLEHGNRFRIDWEKGQKTGFFIDQRENRLLLAEYVRGKKVLNLFGYTGGFSVYARRGGAEEVHTVDSSAPSVALAHENMQLNFPDDPRHEGLVADAFKFLVAAPETYGVMVLDPPAFAKHHHVLSNALQGYKRLNAKAIEKIAAGGILFTFSCSQAVSRENFRKSVFAAAANTGRQVRILRQLSQPPDHPVSIYHPEGEYLKGLVLEIH